MQILSQEPIMYTHFPIITFLIAAISISIGAYLVCFGKNYNVGFILLCSSILIAIIGSPIEGKSNEYNSGRYRYEIVLTDNSVSAKDFLEKYAIISYKNNICVCEDRIK